MSVSVASKNLYELLGNDAPEDEQPTKAPRQVVKNTTSTKKQDEKPAAAGASRGKQGARRGYSGNEGAFRDREAGRDSNRNKGTDSEGSQNRGAGRGRGGRRGRDFDRHSGTGVADSNKQTDQGWGAPEGASEWNDELAGQEIAQKEAGEGEAAPAEGEEAAPVEEEEKTKTYDEYLAELAAKKANLGAPTEIRRPNEGTREDKKWANARPLDKSNEDSDYFAGESREKTRNRERKQKQLLEIEPRFVDNRERRGGDRGGRGGRGGRGDRGGPRGDRSGAPRGGPRGGRQNNGGATPVNVNDASSFPALGAA